ncbi:DUF3105 domain-containing protein [Catellatospora sp. KI3]|uniref:DUF3105 domain-containing protein n=1 Tax=Catellatospora sp. KI3 TaxID=3041620 RepID=UPI0024823792|nr:DUF3105 domain-containing protein [Catellatospora sp. KI3]MDI1462037.1 DUF3105 domain-containing protein [Catellatospora sp. KI3]
MVENAPRKSSVPVWAYVVGALVLLVCLCGVAGTVGFFVLRDKVEDAVATDPAVARSSDPTLPWQQQLARINGVKVYAPDTLSRNHVAEDAAVYPQSPPVGGDHAQVWQNCQGAVYQVPVPDARAVHSLEHGAVWLAYRPDLDAAQVKTLSDKVAGRDYLLMSPYQGLDAAVSVQAWGYQLKVDSADDPRIDAFITAARINAGPEPGAPCAGGTTETGPVK